MTVKITPTDFQQLVSLIQRQPSFATESQRRDLVILAFGLSGPGEIILSQLDLAGPSRNGAIRLVNALIQFGRVEAGVEALGVLIDHLLAEMGEGDDADFLADLVSRYRLVIKPVGVLLDPIPAPSRVPGADAKYIFISYAHADLLIGEMIETYLQQAGFRTFRDTSNIRTGALWDMTIETALHETSHMVLVASAASMPYRKEVYREWFYFDQQDKPLMPLYVQDCTLHSRISARNYIDARRDLATALNKLIAELS